MNYLASYSIGTLDLAILEKLDKMKKSIHFSIATLLILLTVTSCEKDILDQKAVGDFYEQSVFQNLHLVQATIDRAYDNWGDKSSPLNCKEDLLASATDETLCTH